MAAVKQRGFPTWTPLQGWWGWGAPRESEREKKCKNSLIACKWWTAITPSQHTKAWQEFLPTQQLLLTTPDKVASHHMPTVLDSDKKTSYSLILSHSLSVSLSLSLCLSDTDYNTLPISLWENSLPNNNHS
jgi:hypothetical protein